MNKNSSMKPLRRRFSVAYEFGSPYDYKSQDDDDDDENDDLYEEKSTGSKKETVQYLSQGQ